MPADKKTKVMIVDDHPMVREGLEAMLAAAGFTIVGNVESGEQALAVFRAKVKPDVVLMDIRMPGGKNGFETLKEMKVFYPDLDVILMAGMPLAEEVELAKELGARGYLPKTMKPKDLASAIRRIREDSHAFMEEAYRPPESPLSAREMEVLRYIAEGKSTEETAIILGISHETAKCHAKSIRFKLGCTSITQAVTTAFRKGLLRM